MATDDMLDFKKLCGQIGTNFNINTDGEKVIWGKIKVIEVHKDCQFKIFYKNDLSEKTFKTIEVRKKLTRGRRSSIKCEDLSINLAYSKPPGISEAKKKDLCSLCDANVIPNCYKQFYNNINTSPKAESDSEYDE